jgi:hypothetical protein
MQPSGEPLPTPLMRCCSLCMNIKAQTPRWQRVRCLCLPAQPGGSADKTHAVTAATQAVMNQARIVVWWTYAAARLCCVHALITQHNYVTHQGTTERCMTLMPAGVALSNVSAP